MKITQYALIAIIAASITASGCKTWSNSQKGGVIGGAGGAVVGGVIGKAAGNTAMGAIIGATVGGAAGAIIGHQMDKQAEEIKRQVPTAKVERVGEGIVVEFNSNVLFGFDRSDINSGSTATLNDLVNILNRYPDTNIEIQGHTDNTGTDSYNQNLSEKRAVSVSAYLRGKGISNSRITTRGYGESAPKYSNDSESSRAQNRRVDFLITANERMKAEAKKQAGQ